MLTGYDSVYKVSPPLRGESDRMALIAALADGTIDCIAAHHQPHDWDAKAREFEYAASGIGMQESVFPVLWDALKEYVSIELLTDRLGSSPRRIFGLPDATIAVEHKASFTIFNTQGQSLLTASNKKSKGVNNPFIGSTLAGKVIGILNNNQLASTE